MKEKVKNGQVNGQITITNPEDFLDLILLCFPKEYDSGYEKAKHSIEVMEQESKKNKILFSRRNLLLVKSRFICRYGYSRYSNAWRN